VGAVSDRASRRRLMVLAAAGRSLVLASIPLAFLLGFLSLGYLYLAAAVGGTLAVVFTTACNAHMPDLVEAAQLTKANLHLQLSRSATQVAGPGISGLLIQRLGAANAILSDALMHAAAAVWASRLPAVPARRAPAPAPRGGHGRPDPGGPGASARQPDDPIDHGRQRDAQPRLLHGPGRAPSLRLPRASPAGPAA
jgi:MFS family permease